MALVKVNGWNIQTTLMMTSLFTLAFILPAVQCIKCYNCTSAKNIDCAENFDEDNTQLFPVKCEVFEGHYCIKTTGIYQGEVGTTRFCSSKHLGNYCEYIKRPGDGKEYRSCVFTCSSDGCNWSPPVAYVSPLTFILTFSSVVVFSAVGYLM